jgi:Dna[CI] antecedent, DciA
MSLTHLAVACREWAPAQDAHVEPLLAISAAWPAIVGAQVARHSRPLEIRGSTLVVVARSQAWTHQLSFMTQQMLDALAASAPSVKIEQVRFRVGRVAATGPSPARVQTDGATRKRAVERRPDARTLDEVIARFRDDVHAAQRVKAASGWSQCRRCGAPVAAKTDCCLPCRQAEMDRRHRTVARLLFEAPWLGFGGIAALVEGLTERDYRSVRLKLLRRWWETLQRAQRAGRLLPNCRERLIASSYVILKSGLDPERIVPAVVRNLLGDELHDLIYGTPN